VSALRQQGALESSPGRGWGTEFSDDSRQSAKRQKEHDMACEDAISICGHRLEPDAAAGVLLMLRLIGQQHREPAIPIPVCTICWSF
jgi:hypothetical protein